MLTQAGGYRLRISVRYWQCARLAILNQVTQYQFMEPVGFLLAMSTELALKAYLVDQGVSDKELMRIGHDLGGCLKLAVQKGLQISELEASAVYSMRQLHKVHFMRYGPDSKDGMLLQEVYTRTNEEQALNCVAALIDRISQYPSALRELGSFRTNIDWPETPPIVKLADMKVLEELEQEEKERLEMNTKITETIRVSAERNRKLLLPRRQKSK